MTRHYKDLGSTFDSLRSKGGVGGGGGKGSERKEGRREEKKERGLGKEGRERLL